MAVMPAMRVRLKKFTEAAEFLRFLWDDDAPLTAEQLAHNKLPDGAALDGLQQARAVLETGEPFDAETIGATLSAIGERVTSNGKAGPFLGAVRLAVTRQPVSPPLFESIVALGRDRTLARLDAAIALLSTETNQVTET
jgi:glutamyl-tRNA synthetase